MKKWNGVVREKKEEGALKTNREATETREWMEIIEYDTWFR